MGLKKAHDVSLSSDEFWSIGGTLNQQLERMYRGNPTCFMIMIEVRSTMSHKVLVSTMIMTFSGYVS